VRTLTFALRVPSGLAGAETGQPRAEAIQYHTPPYVFYGTSTQTQGPTSWSLGGVLNDSPVSLTTVKPGTFNPSAVVLRFYNPTLAPVTAKVQLNLPGPLLVTPMNALEEPTGPGVMFTSNIIEVNCQFALTTVQVALMGSTA